MDEFEGSTSLHRYENAQMHREMYIAAINSLFQARGAKQTLATRLNISQQYLSYILDPWGHHTPSDRLAIRIVQCTPFSFVERRELLHHFIAARHASRYLEHAELFDQRQIDALILKADRIQTAATHTLDPEIARRAYRQLLKLGKWALYRINSRKHASRIPALLTFLHDAANALNLPLSALWYARLSHRLTLETDLWKSVEHDDYVWQMINSLRMLSASYHNLNIPKYAVSYAMSAKEYAEQFASRAILQRAARHIARDQLNAYSITPRFAISDAQAIADWALSIDNRRKSTNVYDLGLTALTQRSLIEAYIRHGSNRSLKHARNMIEDSFYSSQLTSLGTLVHTLHIRTRAHLCYSLGQLTDTERHLKQAQQIAVLAGLLHQQAEIDSEIRAWLH